MPNLNYLKIDYGPEFYNSIAENLNGYDCTKIKSFMLENRNIMINLVNHLRLLKKITLFSPNMNLDHSFMKIIENRRSLKDFLAIKTTGDGNCFFYCISFLLFQQQTNTGKLS